MRDLADRITWVVVADGEKALFLRNDDIDTQPNLQLVDKEEIQNPPTREQAANRRGRMQDDGAGGAQRSALDDTDWHEFEKERFDRDIAALLNEAALNDAFDRLILFAPPQALGRIRTALHKETGKRLVKEVARDLTNHPVDKIEEQCRELFDSDGPDYEQDLRRYN